MYTKGKLMIFVEIVAYLSMLFAVLAKVSGDTANATYYLVMCCALLLIIITKKLS